MKFIYKLKYIPVSSKAKKIKSFNEENKIFKIIKNFRLYNFIFFLIFFFFFNKEANSKVQSKEKSSKKIVLDKIIARINDKVIFESDVRQGVIQYMAQYGGQKNEAEYQIFRDLVYSKLFLSKAGLNIDIDNSIINVYYKDRLKQILSRYGGSETRLEKSTKMSMEALRKLIKKNVTEGYIMEFMKSKITRNITISNKEIKEYLEKTKIDNIPFHEEQICLKRIVKHLQITKKEKKSIFNQLNNIKKRLKLGEKFEDLAKEFSDDLATANNGGDIDYFWEPDETLFPKKYVEAAINLSSVENSKPPYPTSGIIETQYGMYIIQLLKRRGNTYRTRHILITPKDLEDQKKEAIDNMNKIKFDILNNKTTLDKEITKLSKNKKNDKDYKYSGYIKSSRNSIRFEKNKNKLPKNLDDSIYKMSDNSLIGPFLISTEEGLAVELIFIESKLKARRANIQYDFEELSDILLANKKNQKMKEYILKFKSDSLIYIAPEYKKYEDRLWA